MIYLLRSNVISILFKYLYFPKRKFTENVLQNTPNCTIDKKSGEYAPIPLNIFLNYVRVLVSKMSPQSITTIFDRYILVLIYLQTMGITITYS